MTMTSTEIARAGKAKVTVRLIVSWVCRMVTALILLQTLFFKPTADV